MCLLLEDGDSFVNVGANVGLYACTLARRLKLRPGKNRVYAFEPNPDTFGRLKLSADALGIEAIMCAVSDHVGTLEFVSGAVSNVFTSVHRANHFHLLDEKQSVPCRRLDEIGMEGEKFVLKNRRRGAGAVGPQGGHQALRGEQGEGRLHRRVRRIRASRSSFVRAACVCSTG